MDVKKRIKVLSVFLVFLLIFLTIFFILKNSERGSNISGILPEGVLSEAKKIIYNEIRGNKVVFKLEAGKNFVKKGKELYENVRGLYFGKENKKPNVITSKMCEKKIGTGEIRFFKDVKIYLTNGLEVRGENFIYNKNNHLILCPDRCTFYSDKIVGVGGKCNINIDEKILTFFKPFSFVVSGEKNKLKVFGGRGSFNSKTKVFNIYKSGKILGTNFLLTSKEMVLTLTKNNEIKEVSSSKRGVITLGKENVIKGENLRIFFSNWNPDKIDINGENEVLMGSAIYLHSKWMKMNLEGGEIKLLKCGKSVSGYFSNNEKKKKFEGDECTFSFENKEIKLISLRGSGKVYLEENNIMMGDYLEMKFTKKVLSEIDISRGKIISKNYFIKGKKLVLFIKNSKITNINGKNILMKMSKNKKDLYGDNGYIKFSGDFVKNIFLSGNVKVKNEKGKILRSDKLKVYRVGNTKEYNFVFKGNFRGSWDKGKILARNVTFFNSGKTEYQDIKVKGEKYTISAKRSVSSENVFDFYKEVMFNSKDKNEIITSNYLEKRKDILIFKGKVRVVGSDFTLKSDNLKVFTDRKQLEGNGNVLFLSNMKNDKKLLIRSEKLFEKKNARTFEGKCLVNMEDIKVKAENIVFEDSKSGKLLIGKKNVIVDSQRFKAYGDNLFYYIKMDKMVIRGKKVKVVDTENNSTSFGKKVIYFVKKENFEIE